MGFPGPCANLGDFPAFFELLQGDADSESTSQRDFGSGFFSAWFECVGQQHLWNEGKCRREYRGADDKRGGRVFLPHVSSDVNNPDRVVLHLPPVSHDTFISLSDIC